MLSEKLIIYNPSISTMNEGDHIIYDGVKTEIYDMFPSYKVFELPTQMPVSNRVLKWYKDINFRFVAGTNILKYSMFCEWGRLPHFKNIRQWDIRIKDVKLYGPVILVGCGWQKYQDKSDKPSMNLWKELLSTNYYHSVRDSYTEEKLHEMGIMNVINTGCPTLWRLSREHCKNISANKANYVVTTVTDYKQDPRMDQIMLDVLSKNYEKVYIWLQGYEDDKYLNSLQLSNNMEVLGGGLTQYDALLDRCDDIDYVGTRLHGGVRALQKGKRSVFIAIDNRTIEMGKNFGLNYIRREECFELESFIKEKHETRILIPEENIERFKKQFLE